MVRGTGRTLWDWQGVLQDGKQILRPPVGLTGYIARQRENLTIARQIRDMYCEVVNISHIYLPNYIRVLQVHG